MEHIVGKESLLPRLIAAESQPGYQLLCTFQNGEQKRYNAAPLLDFPAYHDLEDAFMSVCVAYGTAVWPGDIDICPDMLYLKSDSVN